MPLRPPEEISDSVRRQMGSSQPHPHVYNWAKKYNILTDSVKLMRLVLISENLRPRTARCCVICYLLLCYVCFCVVQEG